MAQLTVLNPDSSIADIILISDALAVELTNILQYSRREYLDLALLREIKLIALSVVLRVLKEKNIKINNVREIENFTICTLDWFLFLLNVIYRIEKLPNPDSLIICISE